MGYYRLRFLFNRPLQTSVSGVNLTVTSLSELVDTTGFFIGIEKIF